MFIVLNIKTSKIEFDTYSMLVCNNFKPIYGINDPYLEEWLTRIQKIEWGDYKLFLYGGLLNKSITRDIDGSIIGPWNPVALRQLLDLCYREAFDLKLMPDIKWHKNLNDLEYWGAYPPGMMIMNGTRGTAGKLGDGDLRWKENRQKPNGKLPIKAF